MGNAKVFFGLAAATVCAILMVAAVPTAHAQDNASKTEAGAEAPGEAEAKAPSVTPSRAPFMEPLNQLASILGSMSFLRRLCDDPRAGQWRETMQSLIDAQQPNEADKRRLVASFNSGYRTFESSYRQCTPSARVAVNRYQSEGARIAREIENRYGN